MGNESEKLKLFLQDYFDGNMNKCALRLGLSTSTISRAVSGKSKPGIKLVSKIIQYCNSKNVEYEKYIEFQ